jgi:hypothetical protein
MGRGRQAVQSEGGGQLALTRLEKRFAQFRTEHPRGTRYPEELRQAALGLLGEVAPDVVYRACGVSFRQVMAWRGAGRPERAEELETETGEVRVFSVVAPPPVPGAEPQAAGPELELQIGPRSVSVRLTWRGGACCR